MSFLDLYQGDQDQAARMQPNEGTSLPSGFTENFNAAWSDGQLFSQSVARDNARAAVLTDYVSEIRQKTGRDISQDLNPDAESGTIGPDMFDQANARVAKMKESYPDLDLAPLSGDEIDKRALAKAQAAHRSYETLNAGEKTWGGSFGSFLGSAGATAVDPINIVAMPIAPEAAGASILGTALRWGGLAAVSQAGIEFAGDQFKEQVQPGYMESGAPLHEIGGAFLGAAVLGGGFKALGNAWTKVKTGSWPTSVRDAGNVIESEANIANTNPLPGTAGEVAHREALVKTIDDILAGRPVDVGAQITPELQRALEAERVVSAAVKVNDQIYTGANHLEAMEKAAAELGTDVENIHTKVDDSKQSQLDAWVTSDGRFIDSKEAARLVNSPHEKLDSLDQEFLRQVPTAEMKQMELPLAPETEPMTPKRAVAPGPQPTLQTADQMRETLTAPDHQDAIRADIDRERAMGDFRVPRTDESGNHIMVGVDAAVDEVDAYKALAEHIQVCANPVQEAA